MRESLLSIALSVSVAALSSAEDLVRVPARTYEVTDQITSLKLQVSISEFLMESTEVTQREYEAITASNPSVYKGGSRPVENVSWWDAIRYCNLRSVKEGLSSCYDLATGDRNPACTGYRLPTEAEWIAAAGPAPREEALREAANLGVSSTKAVSVLEPAMKKGTLPVRSLKPNDAGLFDLRGNVWEWCGDYFDAVISPDSVRNPSGPQSGLARVIRGGSFVSTTSSWSRDNRSSMNADLRSRFTGFRVVRSVESKPSPENSSEVFYRPFNEAPEGFASSIGSLTPLSGWKQNAAQIKQKWEALLAEPKPPQGKVSARIVRSVSQRNFAGQIFDLEMEPGIWEKVYVLRPSNATGRPRPVMIVPFYDIDTPAAADLGGRNYASNRGVNAFAYTAAQNGYIAVAVRWFGESYGESYSEAVANLALRHPGATGLGKWVADARRVVDFIETLPDADATRIGIIGHSLGGKMALYAAAFEPRIHAAVSSELGVGLKNSNYEDYWYLGDKLATAPAGTDQHELIGMIAPRPFLLIGGDEYDKQESWHYINAARAVYELSGNRRNIGYYNHHTGHTPSPKAITLAFDWLNHFLKP
jgi:formylglycine-generating enzyme required for sulfatase activity/pimeloyl-ACP methyl ester carboxylesterase